MAQQNPLTKGVAMTAEIVKLQPTIAQMITEVHKSFATESDATRRTARARIRCGQLLLALRERIEAGEAGDVVWWDWYEAHIVRSRRDAEKVMKIARDEDPDAAAEAERASARDRMASHRERTAANSSPDSDADLIDEEEEAGANARPEMARAATADDPVERALVLVEQMTTNQRQRFFAALRSDYAYSH